jgi:tRNA (adenine57-N1/adenine58-N1)-methyltransferase
MDEPRTEAGFALGQPMLLIDERNREHLVIVPEPDGALRVKGERFTGEELAALHEGQLLVTPQRRRYLVMRPTMGQVVMNMPREAQVIYPKDLGLLLMWGDVAPGQQVIEVGAGHGALTMTLLRALGPSGRLYTYDLRRDHLNRTRKNVSLYLGPEYLERWEPFFANPVEQGFSQSGVDRLFSDMPEPWTLVEAVVAALRPGGVWAAYVPTVPQLTSQVEAITAHRDLCLPESFETMQRFWQVRPPSVRPAHSMKAHTGFIIVCRRRWRAEPPAGE